MSFQKGLYQIGTNPFLVLIISYRMWSITESTILASIIIIACINIHLTSRTGSRDVNIDMKNRLDSTILINNLIIGGFLIILCLV